MTPEEPESAPSAPQSPIADDVVDSAHDVVASTSPAAFSPLTKILAREVLRLRDPDDALREQVARALAEAEPDGCFDGPKQADDPDAWDSDEEDRNYYRTRADAALAALRSTS